jgi:small-conductance mechanosensitive channel
MPPFGTVGGPSFVAGTGSRVRSGRRGPSRPVGRPPDPWTRTGSGPYVAPGRRDAGGPHVTRNRTAAVIDRIQSILNYVLVRVGDIELTPGLILFLGIGLGLLFFVAARLHLWIAHRILARTRLDLGAREAIGTITRYVVLLIGFLVILQTAGINLSAITVLAGAVGIGVGFGLQTIASNFISGLIIMFERPIKVGDRIEVGGVHGKVTEIRARATTVLTNDNIAVIVPNSKFIAEDVVNWTHADDEVRFRIPVSVAYGSDARRVEQLLIEAAQRCPDVLADPPPGVRLTAFGDDGIEFELRVWSRSLVDRPGKLRSDVSFLIYEIFSEHGIEIPFPQRDLHIRSGLGPLQTGTG